MKKIKFPKCGVRIPGITKVYIIPVSLLPPDMDLRIRAGLEVAIAEPSIWVEVSNGTLTTTTDVRGGMKAQLKFDTADPGIYEAKDQEPMAFIARTSAFGDVCIGSRDEPYPEVEFSETTGEFSGDPSATHVEITLETEDSAVVVRLF